MNAWPTWQRGMLVVEDALLKLKIKVVETTHGIRQGGGGGKGEVRLSR
jgi:hypothetical protein